MISMDPNRFGPHPSSINSSEIPDLTATQKHSLKRVSDVARQTELKLDLRRGDMLFFNNWALLHRRDPYEDDAASSRHLVRLWLRNSKLGWSVPPQMKVPWSAAFERPDSQKLYPIVPLPVYKVPKYSAGSAAFVIEDNEDATV